MAIDTALRAPSRIARTAPLLLAVALVCGVLGYGLALRATSLVTQASVLTVDASTEAAVTAVGALVATWLAGSALLTLACLAARLAGRTWRAGEHLVHRCAPSVVRRALVVAVGATVGLGAVTGASAAVAPTPVPSASAVSVAEDDLGWVVTTPHEVAAPTPTPTPTPHSTPASAVAPATPPTPAAAPAAPAAASATPAAAPASATTSADVVVARGDTLWAIAARHLPPDATDAEIAESWPRWYRANAAVIGADPGLLLPGQVLAAPDGASS